MRVRRRRGIHVLMGTLALVAGCSTAQRAEVSGVVRDRATGRVIAGARIVGADGSLAETDGDGRFHLWVRGEHADVRVSAAGHSSSHLEIEGLEANVELAPIDDTWGESDPSAHVLSFVEETWTLDAGAVGDASTTIGPCHAGESASACAGCHAAEAAAIAGGAAHDGLGGGCLACHGEITGGDASASCARCHGDDARARSAEIGHFFALATSSAWGEPAHGTAFEVRSTAFVTRQTELATWARALARDRSHGAHDPRGTITLGRALAP